MQIRLNLPDPGEIPKEIILPTLMQLSAFQQALALRLVTEKDEEKKPEDEDRLLDAKQVAEILHMPVSSIYRLARGVPFTRRIPPKGIRFSKRGLMAWIDRRRS